MSYQTEFPTFPENDMPAIPHGWLDKSWHNNACPSFSFGGLEIFINWADPQEREFPEMARFIIMPEEDPDCELLATESWDDVLAYFVARKWSRNLGLGFHPDTRATDYEPALSDTDQREYASDMETLFKAGSDPYGIALNAMLAIHPINSNGMGA